MSDNTYLDKPTLEFKYFLEDLFKKHGFQCRKLIYTEVYYSLVDIFKCLNLVDVDFNKMLNKIYDKNKFTINQLQEKFLTHKYYNIDPNHEFINNLSKHEKLDIYINISGLYELLLSINANTLTKDFQNFIFNILTPELDKFSKTIIRTQLEKQKDLEIKIEKMKWEQLNLIKSTLQ